MNYYEQAKAVAAEVIEKTNLKSGQILIVGCSTSEVLGERIGSNSSPDTAKDIFDGIYSVLSKHGIYLAAQCCEHLNRAVIVESAACPDSEGVNVVPQPKAGGSFATMAYNSFASPVVLEEIKADAGIDIGYTLIGMHLKKVAVPVRLQNDHIGSAKVLCARTRPKFIGGVRAVYDETLL